MGDAPKRQPQYISAERYFRPKQLILQQKLAPPLLTPKTAIYFGSPAHPFRDHNPLRSLGYSRFGSPRSHRVGCALKTGTAPARLVRPSIKPTNYAMGFPMEQCGLCTPSARDDYPVDGMIHLHLGIYAGVTGIRTSQNHRFPSQH
jgi:hypothetical protein